MLFFLEAFFELSTDRQIGMGVGPIPYTSLECYAQRYDFEGSDFDVFKSIIRSMDELYLSRQKKETGKSGKP